MLKATFVREGIHDFDLAIFDVDEAIDRVAGLHKECACRIARDGSRCPQRRDVRLRQRYALHLVQIAANRLQWFSPVQACSSRYVLPGVPTNTNGSSLS
jgi:hypothetical protein